MKVEVVTRRSCHLCDEVLEILRMEGVDPGLVDVDEDSAAFDLYDFRVPVVLIDGRLALEGRITAAQVREVLRRAW